MVINRTVTLVLGGEGQIQIIVGGEMTPGEGVNACRAAADWFQAQGVEAEVARRVEEQVRGNGRGSVDPGGAGEASAPTPALPAGGEGVGQAR
jgi:hypothetical protein